MPRDRKMSLTHMLGGVKKKMTRKMTIADPSAVRNFIQAITPGLHHLQVEPQDRTRASSVPPSFCSSTHDHPGGVEEESLVDSDEEYDELHHHHHQSHEDLPEYSVDGDYDDYDEYEQQFLEEFGEDTPKSGKGGSTALLTRALSFKGRLSKIGGMKSPLRPSADKIVKVEPSGGSDTLESKVEHVWRALNFYRSVVEKRITEKSINDMLPGSATVVLEMVAALNLALKPSFSNPNSSAVAEAVAGVNRSLAELVRWSDQLLLHDDHHHNTLTVEEVVSAVKDAVQALVDLAADKENMLISDTSNFPSSLENNNSLEKSPTYYSKRHSDVSSHRNSLPEIKADSPTERGSRNLLSVSDGVKLSHSVSSDSILTGPDLETPPPKPPLPHGRSDGAPPLPPKRKTPGVSSTENILSTPAAYLSYPLNHSPLPHNHTSLPHNHNYSTVVQSSPLNHNSPHNHHSSPLSHSSTYSHSARESSSDQVSPASSLDSMTQEPPASRSSLTSTGSLQCDRTTDLDFESALQRNFRISSDSGYPSLTSVNSLSSTSTAINSVSQYSKTCTQTYISSQVCGSRVTQHHSQRTVTYSSTHHHSSTDTRSSTSSSTSTSSSEGERSENHVLSLSVPPKLPAKVRARGSSETRGSEDSRNSDDGRTSTYDNVDHVDGSVVRLKMLHRDDPSPKLPPKTGCSIQSVCSSSSSSSSGSLSSGSYSSTNVVLRRQYKMETTSLGSDDNPPPLPIKKKHIHDYMRWFGQAPEPNPSELLRHSVHQMHTETHYTDTETDLLHTSHLTSIISGIESFPVQPPALPPKMRRTGPVDGVPMTRQSLPAPSPPLVPINQHTASHPTPLRLSDSHTEEKAEPEEVIIEDQALEIERKRESLKEKKEEKTQEKKKEEVEVEEEEEEEDSILDLLDVKEFLILKKEGEEGPDIRGGPIDALIVHASKLNKNDYLYQEAFLTTYRTFVTPDALVKKLLRRYHRFVSSPRQEHKTAAHNAFSLLVRVVDDLSMIDLTIDTLETLTNFEYSLLCGGELWLARVLRRKIVEKLEARNRHQDLRESQRMVTIAGQGVTTKQFTLLSFKSHMVAEQMTLLDAELFLTMEIPEVLLWASEQNEERSPNLTTFTEHFNKMSYWARSRILEQGDSKDRERYVMKFIKIMKHLRKMNNFNSYLALLAALDSAPIRRLEWQKTITDGLKEYCALIDSSSSFRAYRQALSDSSPPCIPYIGLILQDLTFVNIGNNDLLPDNSVNFSKRWQQFNILDNMKRFKKCQYPFKRNEDIIGFLDNFNSCMSEESLWDISESIKPRKKKN